MVLRTSNGVKTKEKRDGSSPFEKQMGRTANSVTSILVDLYKELKYLEFDGSVKLEKLEKFSRDDDTLVFRQRPDKEKQTLFTKKR